MKPQCLPRTSGSSPSAGYVTEHTLEWLQICQNAKKAEQIILKFENEAKKVCFQVLVDSLCVYKRYFFTCRFEMFAAMRLPLKLIRDGLLFAAQPWPRKHLRNVAAMPAQLTNSKRPRSPLNSNIANLCKHWSHTHFELPSRC